MADAGTRLLSIVERSRVLMARASALVEIAAAVCEAARSWRSAAARRRLMSRTHTKELLNALDVASRDLQTLKARIDTAKHDAIAPRPKRRADRALERSP
jgi:hypothetical protein